MKIKRPKSATCSSPLIHTNGKKQKAFICLGYGLT